MTSAPDPHDPDRAPRRTELLLVALATVGIVTSAYLESVHLKTYLSPASSSLCSVGAVLDCNAVAASRLAVIGGIPMPVWGLAAFWALFVLGIQRSKLLIPVAGFGAVASIVLFAEQLLAVGSVCMFCELVHLMFIGIFAVALLRRKDLQAVPLARLALPAFGVPALILAGTALFAPPYWKVPTWRHSPEIASGVTDDGQHWIGAESPTLTVHEYTDYACPHCAIATSRTHLLVAEHPHTLRVVRYQQPRMRCSSRHAPLCQFLRAAICAGEQDMFWQMDSWLFGHVSGKGSIDLAPAVTELNLDAAAFDMCLTSEATWTRADAEALEAKTAGIQGTPGYRIDGKLVDRAEVLRRIDAL